MSEGKEINIVLVGCGGMASKYRKKYTMIPGARLALVIDSNEEIAKAAADELGVPQWSTDFKDALAPEHDIVDISTPNFLHAEQAIAALQAGKHVLLQKPIAPTVEEAQAILEAASESGKKAGMYMSMFDLPLYYEVKKILDKGLLGSISNVYCRGAHRGGLKSTPGNWRSSLEKTGGGAFIQLTIHFFDMAQWLLNDRIVKVSAFSKNMMCPNIGGDDVTVAVCEFRSGVPGTLEASYSSDPNILAIYGTKGFISIIDDYKLDIKLDEAYAGELFSYDKPRDIETYRFSKPGDGNPYDQHMAFVKAIQEDKPVQIPLEVGLYDLKVVKAVYKSSEERRIVEVSEIK